MHSCVQEGPTAAPLTAQKECQQEKLTSAHFHWHTQTQGFVDNSFEHITSTEHAMSLLQQFQAILQRESLRHDLESK